MKLLQLPGPCLPLCTLLLSVLVLGSPSQTHTAQHWADTFITELNDTHIEADLRMRHTPPPVRHTTLTENLLRRIWFSR